MFEGYKRFHPTFAEFQPFNVCQAQKPFKPFVGNIEKFTNVQTFERLEMFVGGELEECTNVSQRLKRLNNSKKDKWLHVPK